MKNPALWPGFFMRGGGGRRRLAASDQMMVAPDSRRCVVHHNSAGDARLLGLVAGVALDLPLTGRNPFARLASIWGALLVVAALAEPPRIILTERP